MLLPPTDEPQTTDVTLTQSPNMAATVDALFAGRPSLESVIQHILATTITQKYPGVALDLPRTQLAIPQADGSYTYECLTTKALDYLATGAALDFRAVGSYAFFLTEQAPTPITTPAGDALDMMQIEALIRELTWSLPIGLQQALTAYWNPSGEQPSRWSLLTDSLVQALQISVLTQPGLSDIERETVQQIIDFPESYPRWSNNYKSNTLAYELETYLNSASGNSVLFAPELLLERTVDTRTVVLLCHPGGKIETFASMDAFNQHWGSALTAQYRVNSLSCKRYEIYGDAFGHQAELVLNQQLLDIEAVQLPCDFGKAKLQALYHELSDPALYFAKTTQVQAQFQNALRQHLPDWLQNASPMPKKNYSRYSLGLANSKLLSKGHTFLSGITDINAFTAAALATALDAEQQSMPASDEEAALPQTYAPDKVLVTVTLVADAEGTSQSVSTQSMSLTELVITCLKGRPAGTITLAHHDGLALPDWLTADFITRTGGLIERLDIGKAYSDYLETQLLDYTPEVFERRRKLVAQLCYQLPLQALELHLKQPSSVSALGAEYVATLLQHPINEPSIASEGFADTPSVIIQPLALLRAPAAEPDVVSAMFLIEAQDRTQGPHLLYRPFYTQSFCEFATRDALLNAISQPGDLQDSVLAWLPDEARTVYENGGFLAPHHLDVSQDDPLVPVSPPPAAQLADQREVERSLTAMGFSNAQSFLYYYLVEALIDVGGDSASLNKKRRWTALLEMGGGPFNTLLLAQHRAPVLLTTWLGTLVNQLTPDLPALNSNEPVAREVAIADLTLNLAILLAESMPVATTSEPVDCLLKDRALRLPAPRQSPQGQQLHSNVILTENVIGYYEGANKKLDSALEFEYTYFRNRMPYGHWANITSFFGVAYFKELPAASPEGPYRGLYLIDNAWHLIIHGIRFKVVMLDDERMAIVRDNTSTRGPRVKVDEQGNWSFDMRLRVKGGSVLKRLTSERTRRAQISPTVTDA
jgi:hypothetical protein